MKAIPLILFFLLLSSTLSAQLIAVEEGEALTIRQKGKVFALVDSKGKAKLTGFQSITKCPFGDFYLVRKNHRQGLVSRTGIEIIPAEYDEIERAYNSFIYVKKEGKIGVYSYSGKQIVTPTFDGIDFTYKVGAEFLVKKDALYGIINDQGKVVVPVAYNSIKQERGTIVLKKGDQTSYLIKTKIVSYNISTNKNFQSAGEYLSDSKNYYIANNGSQEGVLDENGEYIIQPEYEEIIPKRMGKSKHTPDNILLVKKNNLWGIIDLKKNIILPIKYQSIEILNTDYAVVGINSSKHFLSFATSETSSYSFDKYYYSSDDYILVYKNEKQNLADVRNDMQLVFPIMYDDIIAYKSGLFKVKQNNKEGIVDKSNKTIFPFTYDQISLFCADKVAVKNGDKYGVVSIDGTVLVPLDSRYIVAYANSFIRKKEGSFETEEYNCDLKLVAQ